MLSRHIHAAGIVRREFLQVGFSGALGMSLPALAARNAIARASASPRAKSVVIVFLTGGPSHLDTFDPKPKAPDGIRGEFQQIETRANGVSLCEHLPMLAGLAEKLALVRSLSHEHNNHLNATHQVLTGHPQPGAFFDKIASRDDYPCYASALDYARPRQDGVPTGVMLPTFLMEGPLVWPGQHAGFLGPRHDPWQIRQDPNKRNFKVTDLDLPAGFSVERLNRRRSLLSELSSLHETVASQIESSRDPMDAQRERAYSLLLSSQVARAFDLEKEDPRRRDRYGRHMFGQSLLLARRLVQAGVPIVQVNMGRVQTWDSHGAIFSTLRDRLLPPTDRGVSALIEDLELDGLLDETLVVVTGEFGRTPKVGGSGAAGTAKDGRDHWCSAFSAVFAGAGVRGGQVIGQTDRVGAFPASRPYSPQDLAATVYSALGVDPNLEVRDRLNRPVALTRGEPISPLWSGANA